MTLTQLTSPLDFQFPIDGGDWIIIVNGEVRQQYETVELPLVYSGFSHNGHDFILNLN